MKSMLTKGKFVNVFYVLRKLKVVHWTDVSWAASHVQRQRVKEKKSTSFLSTRGELTR